jgi:hypothetical protein
MKHFRRSIAVACLTGVFWALILGCAPRKSLETTPDDFDVADDFSWDAVFQRTEGWTGADGVNTADLLDGRILWMFGDTWIGDIRQGRHALNAELVNNSLAVHKQPDDGNWMPPDFEAIRFYWGRAGLESQAWIRPDSDDGSSWYWPTGNGLIAKDTANAFRLLFFMGKLARSPGSDEIWAFYRSGNALVIINNPHEDVCRWRYRKVVVPTSLSGGEKIGWGVSLLSVPLSGQSQDSYLYIYGIDESDPGNKKLILARALAGRVEETDTWQVYHGNGEWGDFASGCRPVAEHLASELSVEPVVIGDTLRYLMVYSEDGFGSHILIRVAQHPEGQWSKPFPIYDVRDIRKHTGLFTYAAKSHACISRPGELLVSYVINAIDFDVINRDSDLYRPRFIRVSLNRLLMKHDKMMVHEKN